MRTLICFVGLLVMMALLESCGDECATGPESPEMTAIFPLAVGNKWIYDDASESDSITASIVADGKRYYVLEGLFRVPITVRMNDQQQLVVRWEDESCADLVLFDFGAEPGDRWPFVSTCSDTIRPEFMALYGQLDSVTVPAGTYRECFEFYWDTSITDVGARWTIAPGIGVVSFGYLSYGGLTTYELVEFIGAEE